MAPPYGTVTEQHDRILIVASGPSVQGVDLTAVPPRVHVIAVNGAIEWCPVVDSFFSLDPSPYVRRLVRTPRPGVHYYMAVPDSYGERDAPCISHRDAPDAHITYLRRLVGGGYLSARNALSEDPGAIHTGNSGWGALGLAYHMRPRKVALLGVDANGAGHAYVDIPQRPGELDHLPLLFASACDQLEARGIQVRNGSPESNVTCWPRVDANAALRWLER